MPKRTAPRILVVDDEPGTVDVMLAVLSDAHYLATGVADGRDALASMASELPDLVLLDFIMPVMDGGETLRAMRATSNLAKVPVIIMSGLPEAMVKRKCRKYDAFLRKPFALDELLTAVERLVRQDAPRRPS